jgi:hypothetical protein
MKTVRERGRGYQLCYQVDGQRHEETVRVETEREALRIPVVRDACACAEPHPQRVVPIALSVTEKPRHSTGGGNNGDL